MVFTNLGSNEKDAFFSLLDEYFASRPEIFGNSDEQASAKTSVARALTSNSEAATNLFSAGLRKTGSPYSVTASNSDVSDPAPSLPRRGTADSPPPPTTPSTASLKSVRRIGSDVDTTSAKNMFSSVMKSTAKKNEAKPPIITPSAFGPRKNAYGPPPSRAAAVVTPPAQEEPEEEPEEEAQGEWAEALYDYDSTDPGDLQIRANKNVWVTERTSDDWWTGEFEGKTGLFPASYVKIL